MSVSDANTGTIQLCTTKAPVLYGNPGRTMIVTCYFLFVICYNLIVTRHLRLDAGVISNMMDENSYSESEFVLTNSKY